MSMMMAPDSVDSIVCDPPYGLSKEPDMAEALTPWLAGDDYTHSGNGFMGHTWDSFVPGPSIWREAYRVLKPGGHLIAFFGTRTYALGVIALRLAGFEVRDQMQWIYGSGFPKSLNIGKAIASGSGRPEDIRRLAMGDQYEPSGRGRVNYDHGGGGSAMNGTTMGAAGTEWDGWGTALKPAHEPIVLARKPLSESTVAANVLRWGTGALNIDASRVGTESTRRPVGKPLNGGAYGSDRSEKETLDRIGGSDAGRFPANVLHDGSDEVLAAFPDARGQIATASTSNTPRNVHTYGGLSRGSTGQEPRDIGGSAARFFYCAKASKLDRNEGCESLPTSAAGMRSDHSGQYITRRDEGYEPPAVANGHPTVKPTDLMRYLCRLVTPPGGLVLDPFAGSGSTGKAALLEGFRFVGCEMTAEYLPIIEARLARAALTTASSNDRPDE